MTHNIGIQDLNQLSLFAGLNEKILQEILDDSQIYFRKKGNNLFMQEEKISRFYVILSGAVRLFIGDEEGEEATLHIIDAGEFVNDVFAKTSQFGVQAIEDCTILSISCEKMQAFLKKDLSLAHHFNVAMAARNNELFGHLARLRLFDAKKRIGRFLLGEAFQDGGEKSSEVEFKCSKSVIASYLGVNPETLSRVLKRLKDDGEILIEKNRVVFLKKDSLCDYCDEKISEQCHHRQERFCKAL